MNEKVSILKSLTKWFEKLAALPKALISIISVAGIISGYMAIHDNKVIAKYKKVNEQELIRNQLNQVLQFQKRDSIYNISGGKKIDSLITEFGLGMSKVDAMRRSDENLKNYLIKNAATKQDVLDIMKVFDEKKN